MKKLIVILLLLFSMIAACTYSVFAANGVAGYVDNNGVLTASDAAVVLQKVLNNSFEMPIENVDGNFMDCADVDGDVILTSADSAHILQKVLDSGYRMPIETTESTTELTTESKTETTTEDTNDILIVYFSHTGTTRNAAELVYSSVGGDMVEITPVNQYPGVYSELLNQAQSEISSDARPAINVDIDDISKYNTILVGYPIWWNTVPPVVRTFFDSYDLSRKTIMPFCTSGGSGINGSMTKVRELCPNSNVIQGIEADNQTVINNWLRNNGLIE